MSVETFTSLVRIAIDTGYQVTDENEQYLFPLVTRRGFHNTPSVDRILDDATYSPQNVVVRPSFLNSTYAYKCSDLPAVLMLRTSPRLDDDIQRLANQIRQSIQPGGKLWTLAGTARSSAKRKASHRRILYLGGLRCLYTRFLMWVFIQQGGRSSYSGIPLTIDTKRHNRMVSLERLESGCGPYDYDNITLVEAALNAGTGGKRNRFMKFEERVHAARQASFNQQYWDMCTNVSDIRRGEISHAVAMDRERLMLLLHDLINDGCMTPVWDQRLVARTTWQRHLQGIRLSTTDV
jgi:hypothetical protein